MTAIDRQVHDVKQRMFTDAEVQAAQPNMPLSVLRARLAEIGFDLARLRAEIESSTYRVFEHCKDLQPVDAATGEIRKLDEITWPDGTVMRWAAMARGRQL